MIVGIIWVVGGVRFELDPTHSVNALTCDLHVYLFSALFEEALRCGFFLQRLVVYPSNTVLLAVLNTAKPEFTPTLYG